MINFKFNYTILKTLVLKVEYIMSAGGLMFAIGKRTEFIKRKGILYMKQVQKVKCFFVAVMASNIILLVGCAVGASSGLPDHTQLLDIPQIEFFAKQDDIMIEPTELEPASVNMTTTQTLSLDDLKREALLNNPELKADFERVHVLIERIAQARSFPDPVFTYTQWVDGVQTRTGEQEFMFALSQKFPWFGKLMLKGKIADADAQAAMDEYRANMLTVLQNVEQTYHWLSFNYSAYRLRLEEKDLLQQIIASVSQAYAAGLRNRQALLKTQTAMARVDNDLLTYPPAILVLEAKLNKLTGAPVSRHLPPPDDMDLKLIDLSSFEFISIARKHRPEFDKVRQLIAKANNMIYLAKKDYYPDISLGVNYVGIGERPDNPMIAPEDEGDDAWGVVLGFNIPIPNARRRAQVAEARHMEAQYNYALEALDLDISSAINSIESKLIDYNNHLLIFEDNLIPLAQETLEVSRQEYRTGSGSFLDLLDAERTLLELRLEYLRLVRDYNLELTNLERALGVQIN